MVTYAVIPGNSFRSGFAKSTMVSYVTTFCTVVAFMRTWLTMPRNVSFGNASTLKVTSLPTLMFPTSDSSVFARSEEHTSELQSRLHLVCRLLLEKKKHIT